MQTYTPTITEHDVEELFNTLMAEVEPELMTTMLPSLEFIYTDETEEDHAARMEWYAIAFAMVIAQMSSIKAEYKEYCEKIAKQIKVAIKEDEEVQKNNSLSRIEDSLQDS